MDWNGHGVAAELTAWLAVAAAEKSVKERRLDPFATSMRDFDDVSPDLLAIQTSKAPNRTDAAQRITDLKGAGLVSETGDSLTDHGAAVISAWTAYGVASSIKADELARLLIWVLEGLRTGAPLCIGFVDYWKDLRTSFSPLELIENWDALYVLNYLDYPRGGFAPGQLYRADHVPAPEIEFDLQDFAEKTGSADAVRGAERIQDAIQGKIPRGRHRSTFCMALELVETKGVVAQQILESFGFPKKPRLWDPFTKGQVQTVLGILQGYKLSESGDGTVAGTSGLGLAAKTSGTHTITPALSLPETIDFGNVRVDAPIAKKKLGSAPSAKNSGSKKIDYLKKAETGDATGKLGEEFALRYERWRLREHPDLLSKVRHASLDDDTLGYDIESFEIDGTEVDPMCGTT